MNVLLLGLGGGGGNILRSLKALFQREITPDVLKASGLVSRGQRVKVLGRGDISKALTIRAHKFSAKAQEKIAGLGGKAEVLES